MDKRRWIIGGMWAAAIAAIVGIYVAFEPPREDGSTRDATDAPTFVAGEDMAPAASRAELEVGPDPGAIGAYRGGVRHTGRSPYEGPSRPRVAWRHRVGERISAQAVASESAIFVGTHGRELLAISHGGERRWTTPVHHRVWSAAAVHEGVVFVGSDADALFAIDAGDGAVRWRLRAPGDVDGAITVAEDGTLYFTGGPYLFAASPDGEVRWRFQARGPFLLSAPAIDSDGTIYVASIDDHLYAVAPDGRMRWDYATGDDISSSPVIGDDGTVYLGSDDHHVHAVTRDGERRWARDLDGFVRAPVALGRSGDVIAAVYGPRPRVVSLDARTGDLRWYFPVQVAESSEIGIGSGPLVDAAGSIYFGAQDDYVYSLGADGHLRWIHQTGGDVDAAPLLLPDGTLVIGCDDGFLYAFREAEGEPGDAGVDAATDAPVEETVERTPQEQPAENVGVEAPPAPETQAPASTEAASP